MRCMGLLASKAGDAAQPHFLQPQQEAEAPSRRATQGARQPRLTAFRCGCAAGQAECMEAPAKAEPPASLVRVGGPGAEGYDVPCAAEEGVDLAKCVGAAKFKAWAGAASRPPRVNH